MLHVRMHWMCYENSFESTIYAILSQQSVEVVS